MGDADRICSNCSHSRSVEGGTKTSCAWEKHVYPPPVFRERFWGKNAPFTWDEAAKDCHHFAPKATTPPISPEEAQFNAIRHHERFGPLDEHGNPLDPRRTAIGL